MDPALPPAGWYPDPYQPDQDRWWDGTTWTDSTIQAAPNVTDPLWQHNPDLARSQQLAATPAEGVAYIYDIPDEPRRRRAFGRTFWTIVALAAAYTAGALTATFLH